MADTLIILSSDWLIPSKYCPLIGCRELVARKCGNEFDKYLACGSDDGDEKDEESGGDNIGIAASGDVICCENR